METSLKKHNFIHSLVTKKTFWIAFCTIAFVFPLYRAVNRNLPEPLPVYYKAQLSEMTTEDNLKISESDMRGKVYLASFLLQLSNNVSQEFKTNSANSKRVKGLGDRVALLSITVDPENDTPKKLFKVAREWKANPFIWKFLTADLEHLKKVLVDGFKVPVGDKEYSKSIYDIAHSEKLVLVDQKGFIRGYYKMEKNDINKLMIDLGLLANNAFSSSDS